MSDLKAIPTKHNGYSFRSRLEARWAVFFDALEIRYEYEPEGFDMSGIKGATKALKGDTWYLPDFYLPDYGYYVEIKPDSETISAKAITLGFEKNILCIFGSPGHGSYELIDYSFGWIKEQMMFVFGEGRKCDRLWLVGDDMQRALNCSSCWSPKCGDKETWEHKGMEKAYDAARSAKFHR